MNMNPLASLSEMLTKLIDQTSKVSPAFERPEAFKARQKLLRTLKGVAKDMAAVTAEDQADLPQWSEEQLKKLAKVQKTEPNAEILSLLLKGNKK